MSEFTLPLFGFSVIQARFWNFEIHRPLDVPDLNRNLQIVPLRSVRVALL